MKGGWERDARRMDGLACWVRCNGCGRMMFPAEALFRPPDGRGCSCGDSMPEMVWVPEGCLVAGEERREG